MSAPADTRAPARAARGAGPRAKTAIAFLIALVSVCSSIAAWRSDVALQDRDVIELQAGVQDLDRRGIAATVEANLADSRITLVRMRAFLRRARALEAAARPLGDGADARRLRARAAGYRAMAATARERVVPDLFPDGGPAASPDYARARRLAMQSAEASRDLDPGPEIARAERVDQRASDWRWISLALLGAALCFTLAEVARSRLYLAFLAAGALVLVATAVWASGIELVT